VERVYFNHNATTLVASEVLEAMLPALDQTYGNASSIRHFGQAAKHRLEAARR
jgi:cysteine desulfurase